jgi:hypothetical protein
MHRHGLALRLLLSLLLVLNGIGSAVAGVRMAMPAGTGATIDTAVIAAAAQPPCHPQVLTDAAHAMPMTVAGDHRHGDGDCCTSGVCDTASCDCFCVLVATILPIAPGLVLRPVALPQPTRSIAPPSSPPRREPERPPIA